MALLDSLGSYLTTAGVVGGATGWTLALGWEPPTPDQTVTLIEAGGRATDPGVRHPRFQVRVRGSAHGYSSARTRIESVYSVLHDSAPGYESSPSSGAIQVQALDEPILIDTDELYRPIIVQRYEVLYAA